MDRRTFLAVVAAGAFLFAVPVSVAAQVDLAVTRVTASVTAFDAGSSATFGATVSLSAEAPEPLTPLVEFLLYSDAAMTSLVTSLCHVTVTVAPGGEATVACSQTIPSSLASGTYFVAAQVNKDGRYPESNDGNNSALGPAIQSVYHRPDFSVASVTASATALYVGGSATFSATVSSAAGASEAAAPFTVVGLYSDAALTARVAVLCADTVWVAPGGTGTLTCTNSIPATMQPGTYYAGAQVNADARYLETNDANDSAAGPTIEILARAPDFTVAKVTASGTQVDAGGFVTFGATVSCGPDASGTFTPVTEFLLFSDAAMTSVVTPLCHASATVASGANAMVTCSQTIPPRLRSGTYFVGAQVNGDGSSPESNGTNNTALGPTILVTYRNPDFTVTGVTVSPAAIDVGGSAVFSATVSSAAGASEAATPLTAITLFSDEALTARVATLCSDTVWLGPGGTGTLSCTRMLPGDLRPGTYFIGAQVNGDARYLETSTTNNDARGPAFLIGPDLLDSGLSAPDLAAADSWIAVIDTVINRGATSGSFVVSYYLSADAEITTSDVLIGTRAVTSLAAGMSSTGTTSVRLPAGVSGHMYLGAIVDSGLTVAEANESNNSSVASPLDLFVDAAPPVIAITGVRDGELTNAVPLSVCYAASDDHLTAEEGNLDGIPFRGCTVATSEGAHTLSVTATDLVGHVATAAVSFTIDTTRPSVTILSPSSGTSRSSDVDVIVSASDAWGVSEVVAGGVRLVLGVDGTYQGTVSLSDGANTIVATARDRAGNSGSATVDVTAVLPSAAPLVVAVSSPVSGFTAASSAVYVQGRVTGGIAPIGVFVNSIAVSPSLDGTFGTIVSAPVGAVTVSVEARDAAGNTAVQVVSGTRSDTPAATNATARDVAPRGSMRYLHDAAGNLTAVIDTARDVNNCGQIATQCPVISAGGQATCVGGVCGAMVAGVFLDVWTDPAHCGPSLTACQGAAHGVATCTGGVCGLSCSGGYVPAGSACVDLVSNSDHCGRVGNACAIDATCQFGQCTPIVSPGGGPVVYRVNGASAPGAVFRSPLMTGIRLEGMGLDTITSVGLEDWGPDAVGTEANPLPSAPAFAGWWPSGVAFRSSPTSVVIPQVALESMGSDGTSRSFAMHRWYKLSLSYRDQNGNVQALLVDVAVSLDDRQATAPPPIITGIGALEVRYTKTYRQWDYDPSTGFLPLRETDPDVRRSEPESCGANPLLRPPSAVLKIGDPLQTELPVYGVTPYGVYIQAGLTRSDVQREVYLDGEAVDAYEVTLVYPYQDSDSNAVNLAAAGPRTAVNCGAAVSIPQVGGLILRGANLFPDSSLTLSNPVGTRVPGDLGAPVFLEDRIVIRPSPTRRPGTGNWTWIPMTGIQNASAFVVLASPRGGAATPWPVRWIDAPAIQSVGPRSFVTYDQMMTLTGRFFTNVTDVSFTWLDRKEHLTRAQSSPPAPEQFYLVDDNHIQLALSPQDVVVPRQLASLCIGGTAFSDVFPGTRGFEVANVVGSARIQVDALDRSGPATVAPPITCHAPPFEGSGSGGGSSSSPPAQPESPGIRFPSGPSLPDNSCSNGSCN